MKQSNQTKLGIAFMYFYMFVCVMAIADCIAEGRWIGIPILVICIAVAESIREEIKRRL